MTTPTEPAEQGKSQDLVNPDYIAMVCPVKNCRVAIVSPRELSRVAGTITDPPTATSGWQRCPKHSEEGDYMEYFDADGNQISGDPETFTEVSA